MVGGLLFLEPYLQLMPSFLVPFLLSGSVSQLWLSPSWGLCLSLGSSLLSTAGSGWVGCTNCPEILLRTHNNWGSLGCLLFMRSIYFSKCFQRDYGTRSFRLPWFVLIYKQEVLPPCMTALEQTAGVHTTFTRVSLDPPCWTVVWSKVSSSSHPLCLAPSGFHKTPRQTTCPPQLGLGGCRVGYKDVLVLRLRPLVKNLELKAAMVAACGHFWDNHCPFFITNINGSCVKGQCSYVLCNYWSLDCWVGPPCVFSREFWNE